MRSGMKGFGTIVPKILSEIREDPTYARFTVLPNERQYEITNKVKNEHALRFDTSRVSWKFSYMRTFTFDLECRADCAWKVVIGRRET